MNVFDPEKSVQEIVGFLRTTLKEAGFVRAVIGVSGGVDSATVFLLAVRALGTGNVFPVLLPYGTLSTQGTLDAMGLVQSSGVEIRNITRIDIKPAVDRVAEASGPMDRVRKGNAMARVRMVYLFDQAKKQEALVMGTENRTEHLLGYFTRFGDQASDIEPIRHLYKTNVIELARFLGAPENILTKPPSAGLWDGQTDEGEFGFTYRDADAVLAHLTDDGNSKDEVVAAGFDKEIVDKVERRMIQNRFKHTLPHTMPGS